MPTTPFPPPAPGWKGGFEESNPAFAYPTPDLSSLPMLSNLSNIPRIQHVMNVYWPEFSWCTKPGQESTRKFLMFRHDVSQVGYDDEGQVFSIVCPQQGVTIPFVGCLNIEVSVTGQRGWVNEDTVQQVMAADMTVEAKIWFSPGALANPLIAGIRDFFKFWNWPFPDRKATAIRVGTNYPNNPSQPIFPVRAGVSPAFTSPPSHQHTQEAWAVANIGVGIGAVKTTYHWFADKFNQLVIDLFNLGSGNILLNANVLTWNVWFTAPQQVDTAQWQQHADQYLLSEGVDYCSIPDPSSQILQANGQPFVLQPADLAAIQAKVTELQGLHAQYHATVAQPATAALQATVARATAQAATAPAPAPKAPAAPRPKAAATKAKVAAPKAPAKPRKPKSGK